MKRYFCFFLQIPLIFFLALSSRGQKNDLKISISTQGESSGKNDAFEEAIYIMGLIQHTPIWMHVDRKDPITKKIILTYLQEISKFDIKSIRMAAEMYAKQDINEKDYIYRMSRLFILNRFIFNVPANSPPVYPTGGWVLDTTSQQHLDALWPLSIGNDSHLQITGFAMLYAGPVFDSLKEFDQFHKTYGLRKKP